MDTCMISLSDVRLTLQSQAGGVNIPGGIIEHQRTSYLDNRAIDTAKIEPYDGHVTLYMADRYHDDAIMFETRYATRKPDGGWGEDEESYADAAPGRYREGTPSQTAWALLGLMAAGEAANPAVARGVDWLMRTQRPDGQWDEQPYTAVGFPRVFYLRYHGYRLFFPLMAMARYRYLRRANTNRVEFGF